MEETTCLVYAVRWVYKQWGSTGSVLLRLLLRPVTCVFVVDGVLEPDVQLWPELAVRCKLLNRCKEIIALLSICHSVAPIMCLHYYTYMSNDAARTVIMMPAIKSRSPGSSSYIPIIPHMRHPAPLLLSFSPPPSTHPKPASPGASDQPSAPASKSASRSPHH